MKNLFAILLLLICFSCSSDDSINGDRVICTTELVAGIKITVNGPTDQFSVEGVVVKVQDGDYIETLESFGDTNDFFGAYERKGSYTITVTKQGFQTYTSVNPVIVEADLCHVITESREITLIPN